MQPHEYFPDLLSGVCLSCGCPKIDPIHSKAPEKLQAAAKDFDTRFTPIMKELAEEEAPKKKVQRQALHDLTQMGEIEKAPTDEGWEKEFEVYYFDDTKYKDFSSLKSFIASLIQKQREQIEEKYYQPNKTVSLTKEYARGKSEAFSLVRKIAGKMNKTCEEEPGVCADTGCLAAEYNQALTDLLSTLEGK